jgi:hypothetical protein
MTDDLPDAAHLPVSPFLHLDGFDWPLDWLLDLAERQRLDWGRLSIVDLVAQCVTALQHFASRARRLPAGGRPRWSPPTPSARAPPSPAPSSPASNSPASAPW